MHDMRSLILGFAIAALAGICAADVPDRATDPIGALIAEYPGGAQSEGAHVWARGEQIEPDVWSNARPVDYRQHHLRRPQRGYEWRESHGQYLLANPLTGVVAATAPSP
jgi:Ni/Co efflux regulator RcnB